MTNEQRTQILLKIEAAADLIVEAMQVVPVFHGSPVGTLLCDTYGAILEAGVRIGKGYEPEGVTDAQMALGGAQ